MFLFFPSSPSRSRSVSPAASTASTSANAGSARPRVVSTPAYYHSTPAVTANGGTSFSEIFGDGPNVGKPFPDTRRGSSSSDQQSSLETQLSSASVNRNGRTQSPFLKYGSMNF